MRPIIKYSEVNLRNKQFASEYQKNLSFGTTYSRHEGRIAAAASMCLKACLDLNESAREKYLDIVLAWSSPGMEKLENDIIIASGWNQKDFNKWINETLKQEESGIAGKPFEPFVTTCQDYKDNPDVINWYKLVSEFIRLCFNKQSDIENERPKVLIENAPLLVNAISFSSCADYMGIDTGSTDNERLGIVKDLIITTRRFSGYRDRKIKSGLIKAFKSHGYRLLKEASLYQYAVDWYKSRINPGTIEEYVNELATRKQIIVDRSRIEANIAICDGAIPGYRRKK